MCGVQDRLGLRSVTPWTSPLIPYGQVGSMSPDGAVAPRGDAVPHGGYSGEGDGQ